METQEKFKVKTLSNEDWITDTITANTLSEAKRKALVVAMENLPSETIDEMLETLGLVVEHTQEFNTMVEKELTLILRNMELYATKNKCEFKKTHIDYRNEDHIIFNEAGFYIEFVVMWNSKLVDILKDVEDTRTLSFKEFWKFQNHFLNGA